MNRPYIFCHMLVSVDGKIVGSYSGTPEGKESGDLFYDLALVKPHIISIKVGYLDVQQQTITSLVIKNQP